MQKGYNLYNLEPQFKNFLSAGNVSPITLKNYLSDLRHFLGWANLKFESANTTFDEGNFSFLNEPFISEYRNYLSENNLPFKTINRRLSTVRKFCSFCISQGWIKENPAKKVSNIGQKEISSIKHQVPNIDQKVDKRAQQSPGLIKKLEGWFRNAIRKIPSSKIQSPNSLPKPTSNFSPQYYIAFLIILIFAATLGAGIYNTFFVRLTTGFAYPTAPVRAGRLLSFQGQLTDTLGNPITTATNVTFKLYNVATGGSPLYTAGACSITPDQDGIFNVLIGGSGYSPTPPQTVCGTEVDASIFSENANVYLGITVAADSEMTPRQQIANVGFAINAKNSSRLTTRIRNFICSLYQS